MRGDRVEGTLPSALAMCEAIGWSIGGRDPALFLDFDGTLAPVASRPEAACLPAATRTLLASLARTHVVCILSGRELQDLRSKVGLTNIYYGADHGRHLLGPTGRNLELVVGAEARTDLRSAARSIRSRLDDVEGVIVETKDLSLSVHYRLTPEGQRDRVAAAVADVAGTFPALSLGQGKLVHELRPRDGWDKGQAMLWLLERLHLSATEVCPVCLGDDITDEDMFLAAADGGVSILVGAVDRPTLAQYCLAGTEEVASFLAFFDRRRRPS
jgi:trehalose-phosphatase